MLRGVALGLAVLGMTGMMAFGQTVSIVDAGGRGYGDFASDDSFAAELWLADFGLLDDFEVAIDAGSAVTLGGFTNVLPAGGFPSENNPYGWSKFLGPPADSGTGLLVATFDVSIAGGDATNSGLGVDFGTSFVTSASGAAPVGGGLAVGGQLVPEPATMALLLAGVGGGLVARRRRRS